ncbi:hypothetical protein BD410DRAFT_853551 [Rickenella mellea]|uniref:BTB domain-containing protein n=1 Tax=Rickenella mellea TaxID=50990 RepID=A0A4Y7PKD5_9AGAM|nr:hypothetical protein BD410DRAFT_853551 [Rickenella mellea]
MMNETDHKQNDLNPFPDRQRHPNLWFEDGNIVLSTNLSIFRVHRGLLSLNSPVFANMLSELQPDVTKTAFHCLPGIPVLEICDDDEQFTLCDFATTRGAYYQKGMPTTF